MRVSPRVFRLGRSASRNRDLHAPGGGLLEHAEDEGRLHAAIHDHGPPGAGLELQVDDPSSAPYHDHLDALGVHVAQDVRSFVRGEELSHENLQNQVAGHRGR